MRRHLDFPLRNVLPTPPKDIPPERWQIKQRCRADEAVIRQAIGEIRARNHAALQTLAPYLAMWGVNTSHLELAQIAEVAAKHLEVYLQGCPNLVQAKARQPQDLELA